MKARFGEYVSMFYELKFQHLHGQDCVAVAVEMCHGLQRHVQAAASYRGEQ